MLNCVIIDDEKKARDTFEKIVDRYLPEKLKIIYSADSVKEGVSAINKFHPELVFLDIEMPLENGFKLFDYFDDINFEVIFLTAYRHYAIDAIKYSAFDYILKPLNFIDLRDVISRYEKKKGKDDRALRVNTLMGNLNSGQELQHKVALPTLTGYQLEKINNIIYCEADENYTRIFTIKGEIIMVCRTLKVVEELLPSDYFFRIHKSYVVNLNYIKSYDRSHIIQLENGTTLEVASRRNEEFLRVLTKKKI
jgi:two-component system, LytTR family, response regulator